jgi:hypothetical protein
MTTHSHSDPSLLVPFMLAKVRRAYKKSGSQPPWSNRPLFLESLLALNARVLHTGSRRVSRVIGEERPLESLLEKRGGRPRRKD